MHRDWYRGNSSLPTNHHQLPAWALKVLWRVGGNLLDGLSRSGDQEVGLLIKPTQDEQNCQAAQVAAA